MNFECPNCQNPIVKDKTVKVDNKVYYYFKCHYCGTKINFEATIPTEGEEVKSK